jgi:hypothetical protein
VELLGVDLPTICEAAADVEPYIHAAGVRIWSLMQLERQLRPRRRAGGEAATPTADGPGPPTIGPTTRSAGRHDISRGRATACGVTDTAKPKPWRATHLQAC